MQIPERIQIAADLEVLHAGHRMVVKGNGPEYAVRFPDLSSLLHYAIAGWPMRRWVPSGAEIKLEWRRFSYRIRT